MKRFVLPLLLALAITPLASAALAEPATSVSPVRCVPDPQELDPLGTEFCMGLPCTYCVIIVPGYECLLETARPGDLTHVPESLRPATRCVEEVVAAVESALPEAALS